MRHSVHKPDTVHVSSYANLVLLNMVYSSLERREWIKARKAFLKEQLEKHGKLICFYCNRSDLKFKSKKRHEQATVDHLVAKSLGGHASDKANFLVCCNSCNHRKGSEELQKFLDSKYLQNKRKCGLT